MYDYKPEKQKQSKCYSSRLHITQPIIQRMSIDGKKMNLNLLSALANTWLKSKGFNLKTLPGLSAAVKNIFAEDEDITEAQFHEQLTKNLNLTIRETQSEEKTGQSSAPPKSVVARAEFTLPPRFTTPKVSGSIELSVAGKKVLFPQSFVFINYCGPFDILYRSVSVEEYIQLCATIGETGRPIFKFRGASGEKFFAPNKNYLLGDPKDGQPMFRKGKREILIKIVLLPYAKPALIYNPSVAGYHEGAENQSLIKKGIKTVRPNHGIIIKYESPKGAHSAVLSSYNIGFRRNDDLVSLADYIVALHIDNVSYLPQTSIVRMLNPEMPEAGIDTMPSAELPTMEIDGDIYTFQGRSYNVMTNPVPNGHCFWSLLSTFYSIPEQLLQEAAGQCRINYNNYVEPEQLEELIAAINGRLPLEEQLRVQLDVFYYTGERDNVRSRTYGSGSKCICAGLVCAPDGYGHLIPSCPGK